MKLRKPFALKGTILYSESPAILHTVPAAYLVCENGRVAGIFDVLPERFAGIAISDYGDRLIIPGLVDLHLHAPQYGFRGLGMDLELLEWLDTITFPEEAKYSDIAYAQAAYRIFANDLAASATTRACIFATVHIPATGLLMDLINQTGIKAMVGKVNMDRNCPEGLREESAAQSMEDTRSWLREYSSKYENIKPILTPRFIPSCTDDLLKALGALQQETGLPLQSHLSENPGEVALVAGLCPDAKSYGHAYDDFGLFGTNGKTIMAHCVHPSEEEFALMKERGIYIAHCAGSNMNISSGVAPVRRYLDNHMKVGLGTDVAGGFSASVFRAMSDAVQASKLRWRLLDNTLKPLTMTEVFYLGTKGGGEFFGKVGSFEEGYEFDAVVLDDTNLRHPQPMTPIQRLERIIYLSDERNILEKYIGGVHVSKSINCRMEL